MSKDVLESELAKNSALTAVIYNERSRETINEKYQLPDGIFATVSGTSPLRLKTKERRFYKAILEARCSPSRHGLWSDPDIPTDLCCRNTY